MMRPLAQVVGQHLQRHIVTRNDADAVFAHLAACRFHWQEKN